jgi:hypothetical protein
MIREARAGLCIDVECRTSFGLSQALELIGKFCDRGNLASETTPGELLNRIQNLFTVCHCQHNQSQLIRLHLLSEIRVVFI